MQPIQVTGILLFLLILVLMIFVIVSTINHRKKLRKESDFIIPLGKMVTVYGHKIHIYEEGSGKKTLVFMSGGGTASPTLDFKSLYSLLSDQYHVVVVEKAGYGFSDITNTSRDIATVLSETRQALKNARINGPYILLPHSMSGIEALYWSQKHPEEIEAIVGLDMATPNAYDGYPINFPLIKLAAYAANRGITRWIPKLAENDAINYGTLTDDEKALYRSIFYNRTLTTNMLNEIKMIKQNAKRVGKSTIPETNYLLFSSNGEGTGCSEEKWRCLQRDFVQATKKGKLIELHYSHYIHNLGYDRIALEIKNYLEVLDQSLEN